MSFPEEVWNALKDWASIQAGTSHTPTLTECSEYVEDVARYLTQRPHSLPPEVVKFYATEMLALIERLIASV